MAQLKRTGRTRAVKGVGYARRGVIHTVPDGMVNELLKTGEWEQPGELSGAPVAPDLRTSTAPADAPEAERERVTEPAPSEPANKPKAKRKASKKKR